MFAYIVVIVHCVSSCAFVAMFQGCLYVFHVSQKGLQIEISMYEDMLEAVTTLTTVCCVLLLQCRLYENVVYAGRACVRGTSCDVQHTCRPGGTNWTWRYLTWTRYPPIVTHSQRHIFHSHAKRASRHQTRIHPYPVRHTQHGINTQAVIEKRVELAGIKRKAARLEEQLVLAEERVHATKHMRRSLDNALHMQKLMDIPVPTGKSDFVEPHER